jgi:hypothetical protein
MNALFRRKIAIRCVGDVKTSSVPNRKLGLSCRTLVNKAFIKLMLGVGFGGRGSDDGSLRVTFEAVGGDSWGGSPWVVMSIRDF